MTARLLGSRSPLYVLSNKERNTLKHIKQSDMSEGQMDSKLKINYSTVLLMPLLNHYRSGQDKDFKILFESISCAGVQ